MATFRKVLFWLHLSAGVVAGIVILIMSATGVALTYERQMGEWANRHLRSTPPAGNAHRLSVEEVMRIVQRDHRETTVTAVTMGSLPDAPVTVAGRPENLYLDAYTGRALGERNEGGLRAFLSSMRSWHRWLAVTGDGRTAARAITGWSNLLFLFIVASGMYLWIPRILNWKQVKAVLTFRRNYGTSKARDFNWHNVIGIWSAVPLFIVVLSAVPISFPWASDLVYRAVGEEPPPRRGRGEGPAAAGRAGGEGREGRAGGEGRAREGARGEGGREPRAGGEGGGGLQAAAAVAGRGEARAADGQDRGGRSEGQAAAEGGARRNGEPGARREGGPQGGDAAARVDGQRTEGRATESRGGEGRRNEGRGEGREGREGGRRARAPISTDGFDALFARAASDTPGWRTISLRLPEEAGSPVVFNIDRGDGGQPHLRSTLTLDRGGNVVERETFANLTLGRQIRNVMRFAHTGEVLGIPGQTVAGLVSGGGVVLVWTGLALSWRRFRAWRTRRDPKAEKSATGGSVLPELDARPAGYALRARQGAPITGEVSK